MSGGGGGDMRRFRFFPSSILSFFWGSPLRKGEEFKTAPRSIFCVCIGILVMSYFEIRVMPLFVFIFSVYLVRNVVFRCLGFCFRLVIVHS